jgi:hypothetical protein
VEKVLLSILSFQPKPFRIFQFLIKQGGLLVMKKDLICLLFISLAVRQIVSAYLRPMGFCKPNNLAEETPASPLKSGARGAKTAKAFVDERFGRES